jgi:hypothetical protein
MKRRNLYPLSILLILAMLFPHLGFAQNNEQTLFKAVSPEYPTGIVSAGNQFFFTTTYNNDSKIWKSDGTSANTQPFLINDADGRISSDIVPFNNSFYFVKVKNGSEMDLWETDGTTKTRVDRLMTLIQGDFRSYELSVKDGKLLFKYAYTLNNVNQGYLLQSTGATGGTTIIGQTNINYPNYSINRRFFIGNNNTVFYQEDSTITATNLTSQGLFVKDALGTRRILNAQTGISTPNIGAFSVLNNELYYTDNSTAGGNALWKINALGTKVKIKAGFSDANPISNIGAAGKIYFQTIGNALWRTDGTAAGTIQVAPFTIFPSSINGTIYYHTDNYTAKIVNDAEVIVGQFPPNHQHLGFININNQIHSAFTGNDNSGYKLFKPNAGQYDLIGYIYGYNTLGYAVIGNSLYYQAFDNRFPNVAHAIYQLNLTPSVSKPDLAIKQADILLTNTNNKSLTVSASFTNIGTSVGGSFKIQFYISSDTLIGNDFYNGTIYTNPSTPQIGETQNAASFYGDFQDLFKLPNFGKYYVIVKLDVDNTVAESNENNNIAYQSFTFGNSLCASKGVLPWEYWIGNVKFGSINNTSDKFKDFNTLGFSDYTNLTTTLSKGQSYPLSISPGLSWIGNVPNAYARAWIDFNNNNIFEANELVLEKNNANPLISNVLVPTNAVTGNVRMRVSVKFGSYPTACETFDKGEVEDYIINITTANSNCPNIKFSLPSDFGDRTENVASNQTCKTVYWGNPRIIDSCVGIASERAVLHSSVSNNIFIDQADFLSWACFPIGTTTISYNYGGNIYSFKVTVIQQSNNQPDLTLSNLNLTNPSVPQGQILNYKADIKNIGTGAATGNFNVKAYISTDNALSSNDIQEGIIPTANFAAGFSSLQVAGATTIPATLTAGQYYLILKVDGDNTIAESNENNNVIVSASTFTVTAIQTGSYCASKGTAPWEQWIENVFINAYDLGLTSKEGYGNFTTAPAPPVRRVQPNEITIIPKSSWSSNPINKILFWRAWIDWNNDGDFNDANETIVSRPVTILNGVFLDNNVSFSVPEGSTYNGKTRLRVAMKVGDYPTPCETFDKGEVEDYTINIVVGGQSLPDFTTNINQAGIAFLPEPVLNVSASISNKSNLFTGITTFRVYASRDSILSSNDKLLYRDSMQFAPNEGRFISYDLQSWTLGSGTFYLLAVADEANLVVESNELNNIFVYPLVVPPVPCATDVTPPVFSNCPQNQSIDVFDAGCQVLSFVPPSVTDNCTTTPSVSFVSKRGNTILSTTPQSVLVQLCPSTNNDTIVYTATDAKGNRATCFFALKFVNQCLIERTIGSLPRNVVLTTSGNCAAYKWQVPSTYFPCQKGPTTYTAYNLISTNPTVTVVRTPPSCQFCQELATDSACFPIGRTVLIYNRDTFHVFVQKVSTGNADIALSITSTPSVFQKYTTQIFKIKAQNVGNQTLTNVKIEFKRPALTSNGGAKVASIGTFSDFCPGGIECSEWTIPTLAAGATATLDAPVFILDPTTAIVATTKLLTSTPVDGNAANNSASVTLTPAAPAPAIQSLNRQKPTQYLPIIVLSIAPNPTEGDVVIEVESLKEQVVQFEFSNTMGQIIRTEKRPLEKGTNQVRFDVYEFPDGVYLIQTDVNRGRFTPTKFVKF